MACIWQCLAIFAVAIAGAFPALRANLQLEYTAFGSCVAVGWETIKCTRTCMSTLRWNKSVWLVNLPNRLGVCGHSALHPPRECTAVSGGVIEVKSR